jgi:hypothetical protein
MMKLIFLILLSCLSFSALAENNRSPAVEEFVGVEPEGYIPSEKGTEVLFNFNQNIENASSTASTTNTMVLAIIAVFLLLPFAVWFGINRSMDKNVQPQQDVAGNVHVLDEYRTETSSDDDIKKAS